MNTLRNLTILFFLTAFIACITKRQDTKSKGFLVSVKSMKGDTIITSAVYYAGHILCLQENNKLFVLDTAFNYVDSLTARFSNLKIQFLHPYNDTILLSTDKDIFYLDTGFFLKSPAIKLLNTDYPIILIQLIMYMLALLENGEVLSFSGIRKQTKHILILRLAFSRY